MCFVYLADRFIKCMGILRGLISLKHFQNVLIAFKGCLVFTHFSTFIMGQFKNIKNKKKSLGKRTQFTVKKNVLEKGDIGHFLYLKSTTFQKKSTDYIKQIQIGLL